MKMCSRKYEDYKKCKDKITRKSPSVAEIKVEIRKQFKERLRNIRENEINRRRPLFEEYTTLEKNTGYSELQKILNKTYNYSEVSDIILAFEEIENEIKNEQIIEQIQQYENDISNETSALLNNLISTCSICDKLVDHNINNVICSLCTLNYFNSENF